MQAWVDKKKSVSFHVWIFHLYLLFLLFCLYDIAKPLYFIKFPATQHFFASSIFNSYSFYILSDRTIRRVSVVFGNFHLSFLSKIKHGFSWESILGGMFLLVSYKENRFHKRSTSINHLIPNNFSINTYHNHNLP